jgi:hypothetical protein
MFVIRPIHAAVLATSPVADSIRLRLRPGCARHSCRYFPFRPTIMAVAEMLPTADSRFIVSWSKDPTDIGRRLFPRCAGIASIFHDISAQGFINRENAAVQQPPPRFRSDAK